MKEPQIVKNKLPIWLKVILLLFPFLIACCQFRVIDNDGSQLGLMSSRDAQKLAREKNLDLVKIAPQATPPVCKIMDPHIPS